MHGFDNSLAFDNIKLRLIVRCATDNFCKKKLIKIKWI
jgi:hypothetical protein